MKILSREFLGDGSYLTYPHSNGFVRDGRDLLFARQINGMQSFFIRNLESGETRWVRDIGPSSEIGPAIAHDAARLSPRVALPVVAQNSLWVLDLNRPEEWLLQHRVRDGARPDDLCSISADGKRLLYGEIWEDRRVAVELDINTGATRELFSKNWKADHIHYCPHDENWVAFCHGYEATTADRVWAWHEQHAPQGKCVFDQASATPGQPLCVGHECWTFHDTSAYVVAYAVSQSGPRGLYEVFADGRPARCLWESDVFWHCNMDRTGRYAVVDTTGPFTGRKLTREEYARYLKRHLDTDCARVNTTSDVVLLDLQTNRSLVVATPWRAFHPYHPHPVISPDTRWIAWNDSHPPGAWLARVEM